MPRPPITCRSQLFPECRYKQTEVAFSVGGESFHWSGNTLVSAGFTAIQSWKAVAKETDSVATFAKGDKWTVVEVGVV